MAITYDGATCIVGGDNDDAITVRALIHDTNKPYLAYSVQVYWTETQGEGDQPSLAWSVGSPYEGDHKTFPTLEEAVKEGFSMCHAFAAELMATTPAGELARNAVADLAAGKPKWFSSGD